MKHPDYDKILAALNGDVIQQKKDFLATEWSDMPAGNEDEIRHAITAIVRNKDYATRIKPKTVMIGDVEVPEPMRVAPEKDTPYWYVASGAETFTKFSWDGMASEVGWLKRGALQATEEGARAMMVALVKQLGGDHKEELAQAHLSQAFDAAVDKVGATAVAKALVSDVQKPSTSRKALKHTKEPWRVLQNPMNPACIIAGDCKICDMPGWDYADEEAANACLIAAAPDLLATLVALVNHKDDLMPSRLWDAARAAIARAEGDAA